MEDAESNDLQREGIMPCSSSEMNTNPSAIGTVSLYKSSIGSSGEAFFSSGWDSFANLGQRENFGSLLSHYQSSSSYPHNMLENPHLFDPAYVEMVPNFASFSSANFSEMATSFVLPRSLQTVNGYCLSNIQENRAPGSSQRGNRGPDSAAFKPYEKVETDWVKDSNGESPEDSREPVQKKPKMDGNNAMNSINKPTLKQAKDNSPKAETSKENYIHVRARRGEATNSHSLAERIRREKIGDRMKLLQELVPGCNKITGKAVMLDEIINYVQSLQRQVEFLSMKLANVNPQIYTDAEDILTKDMLHFHGASGEIHVVGSSQSRRTSMPQAATFPQFLPLSRVGLGSSNGAIAAPFPCQHR